MQTKITTELQYLENGTAFKVTTSEGTILTNSAAAFRVWSARCFGSRHKTRGLTEKQAEKILMQEVRDAN